MNYKDRVRISGFYKGIGTIIDTKSVGWSGYEKKYLVELDIDGSKVWIDENDLEKIK